MNQFEVVGNPFWYKWYEGVLKRLNKRIERATKKMKKYENLVINPISVKFPTANCVIIKYEVINTKKKYEIVHQHSFASQYKYVSENDGKLPPDFDVEMSIRALMNCAYEITLQQ